MDMQELYDEFEKQLIEEWSRYRSYHDDLKRYRGRDLSDEFEEVNEVLFNIQRSFATIYPCLNFIVKRHDFAVKALYEYDELIDDLKKAGAVSEGDIKA
jgi:hypothetical protein